jgi:hypothetical protein
MLVRYTVFCAITTSVGWTSRTMPAQERPTAPPPSAGHALVFHDGIGAVVLVNAGLGGTASPPPSARTVLWKWTGTNWEVLDSAGPPIRNLGGVAYDSVRNRIVLYGGTYSQDLSYDDTWEWHPSSGWSKRDEHGPGVRDHTEMVYDRNRRQVVLFGGQASPTEFPSATWTWDGSAWRRIDAGGPGGRIHHTLVYYPTSRQALLFGGSHPSRGQFGDLWAWTGSMWTKAGPSVAPRSHARLGVTAQGVILVGGIPLHTSSRILRFANGEWSVVESAVAPEPRYLTAMAYDPKRAVTVLYGGGDPASDRLFADTWEFSVSTGWRRIR